MIISITFEVETLWGGERDFHEVGLLELAVTAKVIDDGDFLLRPDLTAGWFDPDFSWNINASWVEK